jgi:hypothetical protein
MEQRMAKNTPFGNNGLSVNLLPGFYQTPANKKFLQATLDQLYQPGTITKTNGYIGRRNSKATIGTDTFVAAPDNTRQNYQLEPGVVIKDDLNNVSFFKDYIDYINQLGVFGGNTTNHNRVNKQEFYSWDPHIDWDKLTNFQNYYWLPYGPTPITVTGQQRQVISTYTVDLVSVGEDNQYVFTPNGFTPNPFLKLYRGQTYKFIINSPGNPFSFKLSRAPGKLNRYQTSSIDSFGVEQGTITFTVPDNSPDLIYYQSEADINAGGSIGLFDIDENTYIDIDADMIGKRTYTLPNGTQLSNGMKIKFEGNVIPESYSTGLYYVEGVGESIKLISESILEIISPYTINESVKFDSKPFDNDPFSDATGYASVTDYIVIGRASNDRNPWSRYNRWFHKDVITASANFNKTTASLDQASRAIRPIIEFNSNIKLFNFGTTATTDVDLIDDFTLDAFSIIEGSSGYNIDGVNLVEGHKVLFIADTDPLVKNKVYRVTFIDVTHENNVVNNQIHLEELSDPVVNQTVLIKFGLTNQSLMYWYNGTTWKKSQEKLNVNQPPLFDIVDNDGISYGDASVYNGTTFSGTKLFSYKIGTTGVVDPALGFKLSYKNVGNIGDIVFNFDLVTDTFQFKDTQSITTKSTSVGYLAKYDYAGNILHKNGWQTSLVVNSQAAVRVYKNSGITNNFPIDIFDDISNLKDLVVRVYVNGIRLNQPSWIVTDTPVYKKIQLATPIGNSDVLTIRAFASQPINKNGYYEIPLNLQNNPLNNTISDFTLGEVSDHVNSIVDNIPEITITGQTSNDVNIRDLGNITPYGTKFVQHSGPMSLSLYHVTSESNNIVKAIEQSQTDYNNFKKIFVITAENLGVDGDTVTLVDLILLKINKDKPKTSPYYFSDMVPYGAKNKTDINVVDYRIKIYPLSSVFTLDSLSNKAVGVYLNGVQLIYGQDYTFDTRGFVVMEDSLEFAIDDIITIFEYENTDGCYIPETPTKLGIWPSYVPKIYLDTTLVTPQQMIQGHDGSQVLAYNDYRDDLILELEKRIFNNIKVTYDADIFDINEIIPSYNRSNDYSREEFNAVLAPSFYKWAKTVDVNYSTPFNYSRSNTFTYNYSRNSAPDGTSIPGYWRGVYRWLLDTDRPNICPWEMLGFTIEPKWWTQVYGPAPYTSDNRVMWQDITDGMVREPGAAPYKLNNYAKPFLMTHIPVNDAGEIVSPVISGLASGTITSSSDLNFVFGDVGPVEASWRRSSHYPFSVLITSLLLAPARTLGVLIDRSRVVRNKANQLIYKDTGLRIRPQDIKLPSIYSISTRVQTAGIVNYLVNLLLNYIFSNNLKSYNSYATDLSKMNVQLSYRIGSFTNKNQFNLLLDSKTPSSTGSVFIPSEDFSVVLNSSSPIKKLTYSGVVITKLQGAFQVSGYSQTQPYFKYYQHTQSSASVNVGGISENFTIWTQGSQYSVGSIVKHNGKYFKTTVYNTATDTFNLDYFTALPSLPISGGVSAISRKRWDRTKEITVPYATEFTAIQDVYDFLVGYGEWLKDQGFTFDDFNSTLGQITNWETSAKEFLFWTTQNWSSGKDAWIDWSPNMALSYGAIVRYNGEYYRSLTSSSSPVFDAEDFIKLNNLSIDGASVISLSPSANNIVFNTPLSVVDDINNQFNTYEMVKVDGTPILTTDLDSYRKDNLVNYNPRNSDGIYGASFYLVQHEHVVIINNTTIFNDTIYNPTSGYRQERIKVAGYITTGWYGGLDIPGFIFDQATIRNWQQWQDYNMGDIINHQGYYYSANKFLPGTTAFNSSDWTQLSKKPDAKILPNWTNIATQFTDFYNLDADSFDFKQQTMAHHLIGYQKRQYLNNIIQDDVSEFKFFQGMIREKGTQNVLNKLFDVLSSENKESLTFYEEWAVRVGQYGANSAFQQIEFILDETSFRSNPQGVALVNQKETSISSFVIQQTPNDVYLKPQGYDSSPWPELQRYKSLLRSAGYVNSGDVDVSIGYISEIVSYDPTTLTNGSYIWCSFEGPGWNIYRFTDIGLSTISVTYDSTNKLLTITTKDTVTFTVGSYIGITQTDKINGFYQVISTQLNSFTISATVSGFQPFNDLDTITIFALTPHRVISMDEIDSILPLRLNNGELLWTDNAGSNQWASWIYNPVYSPLTINNSYPSINYNYGRSIAITPSGNIAAFSANDGQTLVYNKPGTLTPWVSRQLIQKPPVSLNISSGVFVGTIINLTSVISGGSGYSPLNNSSVYYNVPLTGGAGTGALANITITNGVVSDVFLVSGGTNYQPGNTLSASSSTIGGTVVTPFNINVSSINLNDTKLLATVLAISDDNQWLATSSPMAGYACTRFIGNYSAGIDYVSNAIVYNSGSYYQAPNLIRASYTSVTGTTTIQGQGARFTVVVVGASYSINIVSGGASYKVGNKIRISGAVVGGVDTVTDIIITVAAVNQSSITSITYTGIAPPKTYLSLAGDIIAGTGALFTINTSLLGYSVFAISAGGSGYVVGDKVVIDGTNLGGASILNNLVITVVSINNGAIASVTATGNSAWKQIPYVPVDLGGTNSSLIQQGVVSLYKKDTNNTYSLVDSIVSPAQATNEKFGSTLTFGSNVLYVGAIGYNNNAGKVYKLKYETTVKAQSAYNPVGSLNSTIVVTSTIGIQSGMTVQGTGFASGQYVITVVSDTTLLLSGQPDSTPSGVLQFVTTSWAYDAQSFTGAGTYYGTTVALSDDSQTLAVSSLGTVQIYKGTNLVLSQTITGSSSSFGISIAVSPDGKYLAVSDDFASTTTISQQGIVTIYSYNGSTYTLYQTVKDHNPEPSQRFGNKIFFMNDSSTLVIYSQSGDASLTTTFDSNETIFDKDSTVFVTPHIDSGRVDVYDKYFTKWVYSESLTTEAVTSDGYGIGLAVGANQIFVGAPYSSEQAASSGKIYNYSKLPNSYSWKIKNSQSTIPDVNKIKTAFLYNRLTGKLLTYLDVIDPLQGKFAGPADAEIKYKTFYDPAAYSIGTSAVTVNSGNAWTTAQIGTLWWDLRTAKFINSYDNDIVYRTNTWNQLATGASIDVYEWIETSLTPSKWDIQADTSQGLSIGVSGTSLYGDSVYSIKQTYDKISKTFKNKYYYWVKNKVVIPNSSDRFMSAKDVSSLIANPRGQGYSYVALTGLNTFSMANIKQYLSDVNVVLSIEYWTIDKTDQNVHSQYKMISNNPQTVLPKVIEQKWIDSLCGADSSGRLVPDPALPAKLRYGVENRPRQSMFVNRFEALKEMIEYANQILIKNQIVKNNNIDILESFDTEPTVLSNLYDKILDTDLELPYANVTSFVIPDLSPVIIDGKIVDIIINNPGKGYVKTINDIEVAPYIIIQGSGKGAKAKSIINILGQIVGATILSSGEGYDVNTTCSVRNYSVLVHSDNQANGNWSIYSYDPVYKIWSRSLTQSYDVRNYWNYADWYENGFNQFTLVDFAVDTFADLNTITVQIGETVKIRTANSGGWIILEKYAESSSIDWTVSYKVVGVENGTIQLSSSLYQFDGTNVGYDAGIFDTDLFDIVASIELRHILSALKNNLFVGELKQEYLNLFFNSIHYIFSEQVYVDWIFKTSFVKATHNVGELDQPVNYPVDNLSNFEDYIAEVKPYRTKIREYVSNYDKLDIAQLPITDFDLMPVYDNNKLALVNTTVTDGKIFSDNSNIQTYPWKFWLDNVGFVVTDIVLTNSGSGYITAPVVVITSTSGTGATARAFINSGKVNRIVLLTPGTDYLSAPTITLDGGLGVNGVSATAVAIIGESVIRSTRVSMKFDRHTTKNYITQLQHVETFTGTGSNLQFSLKWAPDPRIGKSSVTVDGIPVLRELYKLTTVTSTSRGYTSYSGLLEFDISLRPLLGTIAVTYIINEVILNSADRIEFYYNPVEGQLGKNLSQLMTGIDYGGVIIDGLGFNVQTGWGSQPYYTDKWDSFDSSFDDYFITVDAGTRQFPPVSAPFPSSWINGNSINIYHVKNSVDTYTSNGIRLEYNYNPTANSPVVTTVATIPTTSIQTTYTAAGSYDTTLKVTSTVGIVAGMGIIGVGFVSNVAALTTTGISGNGSVITITFDTQTTPPFNVGQAIVVSNVLPTGYNGVHIVTACTTTYVRYAGTLQGSQTRPGTVRGSSVHTVASILDSTTVILSRSPDSVPSGQLTFTYGVSGNSKLSVTNTANINVGDIVACASIKSLIYNTKVTNIINSTTVEISGLVYTNIPTGTNLTFTRTLVEPTDVTINANGTFSLVNPIPNGVVINVTGTINPTRLDDPYYGTNQQTNTSAIITTPVTTGTTNFTITLPNTFTVVDGDQFIFRKSTSDGSILPPEQDYDTALTGGNLAYSTATGLAADDILVDGDGFVTPTSSPAPEEIVPGQVVDAVAIKVFDRPNSGAANVKVDNFIANGTQTRFVMTQQPNSSQAVVVKVGDNIKTINTDYSVDYRNKTITLVVAPVANTIVSIFNIGFNGSNILDLDYFVGDGVTTEFVTKAPWQVLITSLIYIDGVVVTPDLFKTDETYDFVNAVGFKFRTAPTVGSLINFIIVSGNQQTFAVTNTEKIATDGINTIYKLSRPIGTSLPYESSVIVRVNQSILKGPNDNYFTIGKNKLTYTLDPARVLPYSTDITNIKVLVDGTALSLGADYTIDLGGISIKLTRATYKKYTGKELVVSVITNQGYSYNSVTQEITFKQVYTNSDFVEVISSYNHSILDIKRTEINVTSNVALVADTLEFYYYKEIQSGLIKLDSEVVDDNYIWVIQNNTLLVPSVDYKVTSDKLSVQLARSPLISDTITLVTFGNNILTSGIAYMQFKDMLNRTHFKRLSLNKRTTLRRQLKWNDLSIVLTDATNFDDPNPAKNLPGVIEIRGERIEYFSKVGNVLSKLRRGTLGTGVYNLNRAGEFVQNIGSTETIPYTETSTVEQIISDGSHIINLGFTPNKSTTSWTYASGYTSNIPTGYGQSDDIEVFVGGYNDTAVWAPEVAYEIDAIVNVGSYTYRCVSAHTSTALSVNGVTKTFFNDIANWQFFIGNIRLKKKPYKVHNVNQAPYSPEGDLQFDAEFAVNGSSNQLRLTNLLTTGTQVTVIRKTGKAWDSTVNIQNDTTKIAEFLKATPGVWYADYKKVSTVSEIIVVKLDNEVVKFDDTNNQTFDQG